MTIPLREDSDPTPDPGGAAGWPEAPGEVPGEASGAAFTLDDEPHAGGLFPGDTSVLSYEQRHTLNVVLKNPFLSGATQPVLWRTLLADPAPFISRLHDLFFDLEIDRDREIAIKRPVANPGGDRFPTLVYDSRLTREETIVVLCLRRHYRNERAAGADRVFIDVAQIHDFAENLRPATATDVSGDRTRVTNAILAVRRSGLLVKTREDDRFEVSAAIEILLPMRKLQELLADLQRKNGTGPVEADGSAGGDGSSGEDGDDDLFADQIAGTDPAGAAEETDVAREDQA